LVKEIVPGVGGSNPNNLVEFNGRLFFAARKSGLDFELWQSDGTEAGTLLVKDINPGVAGSFPFEMTVIDGLLHFTADDGVSGRELCKTDGTSGGTQLFQDIAAGRDSSRPGSTTPPTIVDTGKSILFSASDGISGIELWKSDKHGTFQLQDIAPGAASSSPESMTVTRKLVFFLANDNSSGRELWVMPGNAVKAPKPKSHGHKFRDARDAMELLYAQYNNLLDLEAPEVDEQ
jgi:ELWxxDGT repeat protein